jgi:hypothetical protein
MQNLVNILIALAITLAPITARAPVAQSSALTCQVRQTRTARVCWCKANRPGSRWQVYPMIICQLNG